MSVTIHNVGQYKFTQDPQLSSFNNMGMRDMQARAFAKRNSQYLLIKAPPACGKSRALMFLALDKLKNQGLKKVIVSVPQNAIGSSFKSTDLMSYGFFANWDLSDKYDLCNEISDDTKAQIALEFLKDENASVLLCAHPTLINFYNKIDDKTIFNNALVAIDEFHHASADEDNRLGSIVRSLINDSEAHIIAMTGTYFRGDRIPVLRDNEEALFDKVTYTYYEQLRGYKYLKSLSLNYAFYTEKWTDAIADVLDTKKKTIIHTPNVNSSESTKDKYNDVGVLLDIIGTNQIKDTYTNIYSVTTSDGRVLKVADLITDDDLRKNTLTTLKNIKTADELDIIIALGMAKEGFDWPFCEVALTVGYRDSLTDVIQIIGRATRDSGGKSEAKFINLIRKPDAVQDDVRDGVNTLLKAITVSLLMEQVLRPNIHFRASSDNSDKEDMRGPGVIIDDSSNNLTQTAKDFLKDGMSEDLIANIINSEPNIAYDIMSGNVTGEDLRAQVYDYIQKEHPQFEDQDLKAIAESVLVLINKGNIEEKTTKTSSSSGEAIQIHDLPSHIIEEVDLDPTAIDEDKNKAFFENYDNKFINLNDLNIDLILRTNPFQDAYAFVSKAVDAETLSKIKEITIVKKSSMTLEQAKALFERIKDFVREHNGQRPSPESQDPYEKNLGEAFMLLRYEKAKKLAEKTNSTMGQ